MTIFDDAPPALLRNWNPIERSRNEQGLKADSDRALGNVRGKPHADAISIFDQGEFISRGVLRYASYSLDMRTDILPMLIDARRALLEAAAAAAGAAKTINVPLSFPSALPGSYDRIRDRAYFLWENREGSAW